MSDAAAPERVTVGFAGLGTMGWPMARNLVSAGYQPVVYDVGNGEVTTGGIAPVWSAPLLYPVLALMLALYAVSMAVVTQ